MKKSTREWVTKAEDDYRLVVKLSRESEPFHDQLCFHCQQSAEKYLKALLDDLTQPIPRIHDLDSLLNLLRPSYPTLGALRRGMLFLNEFAVNSRYPGDRCTKRKATSAFRWADKIRAACRSILKIRPPRPRKTR